jgi:hypothetical protein
MRMSEGSVRGRKAAPESPKNSLIMDEIRQIDAYEWECYDRPVHDRGRLWHVLMPLAALGLLIYAVVNANFLFAFLVILFAVLIYLRSLGEPERIRCVVSESGMVIGQREIRLKDIKRFWFAYEPPEVRSLYVETDGVVPTRLAVDLDDADPNDIRSVLSRYVKEDFTQDGEPISDYISRMLKI